MAELIRKRYNGVDSVTLGGSLTNVATSITFGAALQSMGANIATLATDEFLPLIIDNEILYLTAYTSGATTGTISRGKEGTTGAAHSNGASVVHGPTVADFTLPSSVTAVGSGTGDYAGSSATMIDVDAGLSAVIAAATGDVLIATFVCCVYSTTASFMEVGLMIGGTLRRSNGITLGTSATPISVQVRYVVQAGDISGGNVTVKPQWKKASGGMSMINDTTDRKPTVVVLNTLH